VPLTSALKTTEGFLNRELVDFHLGTAQHTFVENSPRVQLPAITISRQAGAGAITIGHLAAKILDDQCSGSPKVPWTVFERNLATAYTGFGKAAQIIANLIVDRQ
jgi:hypothetical protein